MTVYADELFAANFLSSYIMLWLFGKYILRTKINKIRLFAASALQGAAAVAVFALIQMTAVCYIIRVLSVFIMVFTAFHDRKRQIFRHIMWLAALSGLVIGAMVMLSVLSGIMTGIVIRYGIVYFHMPYKIFLPLFALSYLLAGVFIKVMQRRREKQRYDITVKRGGKKVTVTALFDSGNLLREPMTGKAVSILEWGRARELFDFGDSFEDIPKHAEEMRLRVVPYHSVGEKSGIMYAFMADEIEIHGENKTAAGGFIGIYDGKLSRSGEYSALINASLL